MPEHIDHAQIIKQPVQPRSFIGQKTGILSVSAPVLKINLLVGNVEVTTQDIVAFAVHKPFQQRLHLFHDAIFEILAFIATGAGRHIDRYHAQSSVVGLNPAPLPVERLPAQTLDHAVGFSPGIDGNTAVALPLGIDVVGLVAFRAEFRCFSLFRLGAGLLQTYHIRILYRQPVEKLFPSGGSYPVNIQRYYSHPGAPESVIDRVNLKMTHREQQFLQFAINSRVLRFGEFTLKSGRVSPYFFNAGLFCTGAMLSQLAGFYAAVLCENEPDNFMLFGPAYKGIVLATATAAALHNQYGRNVPFAYNRKEVKDHGEGGTVVGAQLTGRVVIIDDVITAGTAIGESVDIIESAGAQAAAVIVALDREEIVSDQGQSAITQIRGRYGLPVHVIARFSTLIEHLRSAPDLKQHLDALEAYLNRYGDPGAATST